MDRETRKAKRQAIMVIVVAAMILVFTAIGLVIMGVKNIDVTTTKTLRSEVATKLKNKENFNCTAEWIPKDAFDFVDPGSLPNPRRLTVTMAMKNEGSIFYIDRYEVDEDRLLSILINGNDVYVWSALERLWQEGQLYHSDYYRTNARSIKMTLEEFEEEYPDFFEEVDQIIRDFPSGTTINCEITGSSNYSAPEGKDWATLEQSKAEEEGLTVEEYKAKQTKEKQDNKKQESER